jgi:hypothetical protein
MKKLIATTLVALALTTPAVAFDISTIDGIPADMKDMIARQSGGRITNKQGQQGGQQQGQQQAQDGQQQQGGRQARKKQSAQEKAMQQADQFMKGEGGLSQGIGSFR